MDTFGLSLFRPDFLICSFYKVFGENPTGFGCLFVKKSTVPCTAKHDRPETSKIECRGLDHVDSLGLVLISRRARYLINWLVNALTKLHHPNTEEGSPLVRIYGPNIKFERGPALAFNVFDWKGEKVEPILLQKLADRSNISLSYGFLHHLWFSDKETEAKGMAQNKRKGKDDLGITVVTAALGFLTNFEDIYRLWAFVAQFLDADFVEKERWRYTALNQKTIEV
ncbi:unnamed protein product, partial [Vitis vinifera]